MKICIAHDTHVADVKLVELNEMTSALVMQNTVCPSPKFVRDSVVELVSSSPSS